MFIDLDHSGCGSSVQQQVKERSNAKINKGFLPFEAAHPQHLKHKQIK